MFIVGGIAFIIFGIMIIRDPIYCRGICVDLSGYNVFLGYLCIPFGIFSIWSGIRKRIKKIKKKKE